MSKKIIGNTLIFAIILIFVNVFSSIFGEANTLVGVTVIITMLVLMGKDLTKNPLKNFGLILILNIISGVGAHLASNNIYLGLLLTFLLLGGIGYFLSFTLEKSIIVPFGLQYLFMLYTPVYGKEYAYRIGGLAFGAILVMLLQFIIHKRSNKVEVKESEIITFELESEEYKNIKIFGREIKIHKVRGKYAIRMAFIVSTVAFFVGYFNLEQGRWIVYTVFSLTELYAENCKVRSIQRLQGTIIGALIILILFIFIKDPAIRGIIILICGYSDTYTTNYRDKMICVTASVVAAASISDGTLDMAVQRIGYVFIGILIALVANKFLLHHSET